MLELSGHHCCVRRVFWRPNEDRLPIEARQYYELQLDHVPTYGYRIWRTHYEWNAATRKIEGGDDFGELVKTLEEAEDRYAVHLKLLADLGFTESDTSRLIWVERPSLWECIRLILAALWVRVKAFFSIA